MATTLAGPVRAEVKHLPAAPLSWRLERFPTAAAAQDAATATGLVLEAEGQVWLFTLGSCGGRSPDAAFVAEIGPVDVPPAATGVLQQRSAGHPSRFARASLLGTNPFGVVVAVVHGTLDRCRDALGNRGRYRPGLHKPFTLSPSAS